jgi:hypothetical protein
MEGTVVRKLSLTLALALAAVTSAAAQSSWNTEIGVRGGFTRVKPTGTGANDYVDIFSIPGLSVGNLLPTPATLYLIIPKGEKLAIEPSLTFLQLVSTTANDIAMLGLRVDYALGEKLYAAGGGALTYASASGSHDTQLGVQAALGYRLRLTGTLNGRIEAQATSWAKSEFIAPRNTYGVELGISTRVGGGGAPARRGAAPNRMWRPMLGLQGGYFRSHFVGGGQEIGGLTLPGIGSLLAASGIPGPSAVFVTFPVGEKMAFEPGLDLVRLQSGGTTQVATQVNGRLNYALTDHWYAGAAATLLYAKNSGVDAVTDLGAQAAAGYRFALTGGLGARVEASLTMIPANDDFAAVNTSALTFALTMPLK